MIRSTPSGIISSVGANGGIEVPQFVFVILGVLGLILLVSAVQDALRSGPHGRNSGESQQSSQSLGQDGPSASTSISEKNNDWTSRRALLLGGGGVSALIIAGVIFADRSNERGPEDVAVDFIEEIDDSDFDSANDFIHPNSPLDGAGTAADLILAFAAPGVNQGIDIVDISVSETEVIQESDTDAVVRATIKINLVLDDVTADIPLDMRTQQGNWHVWNLNLQ